MTPCSSLRIRVVLALLALSGTVPAPARGADDTSPAVLSAAAFQRPGRAAGVHAWWHWVDGAITREGITKDLEALARQGVVQVTILNVGLFGTREFGVPRVPFASPEWFDMFRWALAEATRLGLTVGVHNCDGWSSSGGPWITPERSMKQFVWTKTLVEGTKAVDLTLPKPAEIAGFYRDVAVVAFPTRQRPSAFQATAPRLRVNGTETPLSALVDGCPISTVRIKRGDRLELSASSALAFDRVAVHVRRPFMWGDPAKMVTRVALETSDDGREYKPLVELSVRGLNTTQSLSVPPAKARFVRLTVGEITDSDPWFPVELGELELLEGGESPAHAPRIPFVAQKTSAIVAASDDDVYSLGTDDGPAVREVVVLTDKMDADGRVRWQPPTAGSWAILRFGYTSTGATNNPATAEGRGLECDKMDPVAVEQHFRGFPEKLVTEAGAFAGGTFRFVLVDSWEAGFQNWTARLPEEFEKRRGYSLVSWLPALTGEPIGSSRESEAALFDLRQTIADLIRESYYDRMAALLHERRIELHAEVIYGGGGYPPLDVLLSTRQVDLPMFEYWTSAGDDALIAAQPMASPELHLPAAAAVGYGKPLVGSEAYTGYATYSESFADLKPFGDRAFTAGINRMILHSSVHQPTDAKPGLTLGKFGSHFNRNNSTWAHAAPWLTYQARIQSVLDKGAPVFDVLYFLGDQLPQSFARNPSTTLPAGYAVTAVNADLLSGRIAVAADGRLQFGETSAAILSLPPQPYMSLDTLKRIASLVEQGAHVYGPKPTSSLSMADGRQAAAFRDIADRVWGNVDGTTVLAHAYGKGSVAWGEPLGQVLAALRVPPQFSASPAGERDFLFVHRHVGTDEVFFVVNQQDRDLAREVSFRVGTSTIEVWDPEDGSVTRPAAFRNDGGLLRLPIRFRARQALLFVFRAGEPGPHITSVAGGGVTFFPAAAGSEELAPDLRFEADGLGIVPVTPGTLDLGTSDGRTLSGRFDAPMPVALTGLRGTLDACGASANARCVVEISDLRPVTSYSEPAVRYASGAVTYRVKFSAPDIEAARPADRLLLDIGDFDATADVTLNGHPLGLLWMPGMPLDVTGILRRDNELVVTVAIVYRNRLIGDLAQFGEVRSVQTSSPVAELLSPVKPLKPSGWLGPVRVTRVPKQRVAGM